MAKKLKSISREELLRIIQRAAEKTIVAALIVNTPGRGIVADEWEAAIVDDNVVVRNKEFGDVVRFLEYGTKPHVIVPKKKDALRWKVGPGDSYAFAKKVHHPGTEARRFVQRTLTGKLKKDFMEEFTKSLKKAIL